LTDILLKVSLIAYLALHVYKSLRLSICAECDTQSTGWGGMDWIDVAQDWDHWTDIVNTVINLQVP
jgi:hypothetical protein